MSVWGIDEADTLAAAPAYVQSPKPKTSVWADVGSALTAVPRGVTEAAAQVMGSAADLAHAARVFRDTPSKDMAASGLPVSAYSSDIGDALRDRGREFRPDPETASTAEQILYGFSRGATKIVAGAVAGGIPGVLAAGAEEAFTVSDELKRQGVDVDTRGKAGLVQGAGLALAALPAAGTTLQSTLALYAAGGPGGFMAQQALTREILQSAGYDKLGMGYDPLDPVGLTVASLIPAGFAAYGFRQAKIAQAVRDLPDLPKTTPDAPKTEPAPAFELSPVAKAVREYPQEVQDAARVLYQAEVREAANPAGNWLVSNRDGTTTLLRGDSASALEDQAAYRKALADGDAGAAAAALERIRSAEGRAVSESDRFAMEANLKSANQHATALARAEDQLARGEPVSVADVAPALRVTDTPEFRAWFGASKVVDESGAPLRVFHGTRADVAAFDPQKVGSNLDSGFLGSGFYFTTKPATADYYASTGDGGAQNVVPVFLSLKNPYQWGEKNLGIRGEVMSGEGLPDDIRAEVLKRAGFEYDITKEPDFSVEPKIAKALRDVLMERGYDGVISTLPDGNKEIVAFAPEQIKSAIGNTRFNPDSPSLTDSPYATWEEQIRAAVAEMKQTDRAIPAEPITPVANMAQLDAFFAKTKPAESSTAGQAVDATARLDEIRTQYPDLMVQMDGQAMKMDDFLASVKAEADELAADAPLMQAAAECALTFGS